MWRALRSRGRREFTDADVRALGPPAHALWRALAPVPRGLQAFAAIVLPSAARSHSGLSMLSKGCSTGDQPRHVG